MACPLVQSMRRFWPSLGVPLPTAAASGLPGGPGCQGERGLPRPPARGCLCGTSSIPAALGPQPRAGGMDSHHPDSHRVLPAPGNFHLAAQPLLITGGSAATAHSTPPRLAQPMVDAISSPGDPSITSLAVAPRPSRKTLAGRMLHPCSISTAPAPAAGMCSYVFKKGLGWGGRSVFIQPFSRNLVRVSASRRLPELALLPSPAPGQGSRQSIPAMGARGIH